jgi:ribonuclease J
MTQRAPGGAVDVVPQGGLGQFGMNCTLVRSGDDCAVVDCGMMFPPAELWGIDAILPDVAGFLGAEGGRLAAIVLTHGHDDHIGGIARLMQSSDAPVYGSDMTLGLLRARLRDRDIDPGSRLIPVASRGKVVAGPFSFEFLDITHSIPGTFALAIGTPAGTIVHSADFKIDAEPVAGPRTDLARLAEIGREGVRLLLIDSTNAFHDGTTPSERTVGLAFGKTLREAEGRVFATTFSSHAHRIQQFLDAAAREGRKVAAVGRRMTTSLQIARDAGCVRVPAGILVRAEEVMDLPPRRGLVLAGGSQGEPASAMTRIARGTHPEASVQRGDLVVHSARPIPGNEVAIGRMLDALARRGASLMGGEGTGLHVSGHASRDELRTLMEAVRPEALLPVHGSHRHLLACARVAETLPDPPRSILIAENGDIIRLDGDGTRIEGRLSLRPVLMDRDASRVTDEVLLERRHLAQDGILLPVLVLERASRRMVSPPEVLSRGFASESAGTDLLREAARLVGDTVREAAGPGSAGAPSSRDLEGAVAGAVQRLVRRRTGKRPLVTPIVIEI